MTSAPKTVPESLTRLLSRGLHEVDDGDLDWSNAHANFLSSLLPEEKQDLLACSRRLLLDSRDQLFGAGDASDNVYVVESGCIRLFQVSASGRETILWFNFPGEVFGIAELLGGNHRQVYAVANEPTEVYSIHRQDFTRFLGSHPEAALKAIGILSARVRALGRIVVGLASENVETRIARLLLRFAAVSEGSGCNAVQGENELCARVRLTHQDIANLISASRQTVSTTLAQLRKSGVIDTVDQHFHILQPAQLRRLLHRQTAEDAR